MTRRAKHLLTIAGVSALAVGGWFLSPDTAEPVQAEEAVIARSAGSGDLDGMTFESALGPLGKPADVKDTLVFKDGTFVSTECERRCDYPARPYFVRRLGDRIEFISETRCPDKDATIVWRGTVHDGKIAGEFTWTVARWYWTIEKKFWFAGSLAGPVPPLASK